MAMNRTGYAVLTKVQRENFYGQQSPYKNADFLKRTENLTELEARRAVKTAIREVAAGRMEFSASF